MPRNYKGKRGAQPYLTGYTGANMEDALASVESGTSISKPTRENGVPKSSLRNRVEGNFFFNSKICID